MQNIRQSQLEDINWSKQWNFFIEWGLEDGCWKPDKKFLAKARIIHLLGAPQIVDFMQWKEEETKFLVNRYHDGYLSLDSNNMQTYSHNHRHSKYGGLGLENFK
jgi:hypothetical protein